MPNRLKIDQASIVDNDVTRQVEFVGEIDGDERDFAVSYSVLKELGGDEPEDDALELFDRFGDDIVDACIEALDRKPSSAVVTIEASDLE